MKNFSLIILLLSSLLLLSSFYKPNQELIQKTKWLLGTWENKTSRGSVYETWTQVNDYEMYGMSYTVTDQDTILFEELQMIQQQDSLFYIPTVASQNDGMPIRFTMTDMTDSSMVFKHPYHDFPQVISYTRVNPDSLYATISGINHGQERSIVFPMKRIQ